MGNKSPYHGAVVTLSFLSPITPTSTFRQAIPASYLTVYAQGNINISVYIDINGQWVSGDRGSKIKWSHQRDSNQGLSNGKTQSIQFQRESEALLTEIRDRSEWGQFYFVASSVSLRDVTQITTDNNRKLIIKLAFPVKSDKDLQRRASLTIKLIRSSVR